jgi:hypothetical protein
MNNYLSYVIIVLLTVWIISNSYYLIEINDNILAWQNITTVSDLNWIPKETIESKLTSKEVQEFTKNRLPDFINTYNTGDMVKLNMLLSPLAQRELSVDKLSKALPQLKWICSAMKNPIHIDSTYVWSDWYKEEHKLLYNVECTSWPTNLSISLYKENNTLEIIGFKLDTN